MNSEEPEHIEELELVNLLIQKDHTALAYLYDHYAPILYSVIVRIVKMEEVSEEVLQDTFVKIWNNIHSCDLEKARLLTWMISIARNLAIDTLRSKEFTRKNKTVQLENNGSLIMDKIYVEQKIKDPYLKDLLRSLRPEEQKVIHLSFFEGYTHTQISEKFNIPLGTVKTRLRLALKSLRKLLNTS